MRNILITALLLPIMSACTDTGGSGGRMPPPNPGDPYDIQAAAPGEATCIATSAAENATGAAATNQARSRAGLPPVRPHAVLAQVAAAHACDMARNGRMTHVGSSSTGPGPRVKARGYRPMLTAENIAAGPFDLARVLGEWNRSAKHLDNIMISQVRDYGVGRAIGSDGKTVFWSAVYGAPK